MYQIVFTGRLLKGAERATVESELQRLFKATPTQVQWFLRGKPIVVKSCEDALQAGRYYEALTKAGLECELRSDHPSQTAGADRAGTNDGPAVRQLSIPGVSPAPARPERPRQAPSLGRVTQAITAQDRAPDLTALPLPVRTAPAATQSRSRPTLLRMVFVIAGAILLGALAYVVSLQMQQTAPLVPAPTTVTTPAPVPAPPPQTLEQKIVGRWHCIEAESGRTAENEFTADGYYRSVTRGRPDAFQQMDRLDVLVEGRYRLEGDQVIMHIRSVPSRELFGRPSETDDYLYWRIHSLTHDTLVWADSRLQEVRESCLRSQSLPPD